MTLNDTAVVRFYQQTCVHSALARRAVVHPLVDEALQRRFSTLQACRGVVSVAGADVVTMVVLKPT
jgi:hypothetical protein